MNSVQIIGRLVRDPELRNTSTGKSVASFSIAANRAYGNATDFIPCVAWGQTAENIKKYLLKGSMVGVMGSLQSRSYEVDGQKRTAYEVNCSSVEFLSPKEKREEPKEDIKDVLPVEEVSQDALMGFEDDLPF